MPNLRSALRLAAALALVAPALAACSGGSTLTPTANPSLASAARQTASVSSSVLAPKGKTYTFTTLDNAADVTFNQLLGINSSGTIAGYFGIGSKKHPNKGYTLSAPYGQSNYTNENYPGSAMTQVTGINESGETSGFWVDNHGDNFGFVDINGTFTSYSDPNTGTEMFNQLLGINDRSFAVGFYTDPSGINHGFKVKVGTTQYAEISIPNGTNVTAAGINDMNDITGFYTNQANVVVGFILKGGTVTTFSAPQSTVTTPLGINQKDQIVGSYMDAAGATHGFLLDNPIKKPTWQTIDDPNGIGNTVINGLNNAGDLVGFYLDSAKNTDGFLATP